MTRRVQDIAVVVPARNEEARIGSCIDAIATQVQGRAVIYVAVNNSTDATAAVARSNCRRWRVPARILDIDLPQGQGVGTARRIGAERAIADMPRLRYLLSTDADSVADPDWIDRNVAHLAEVDAVCGNVSPILSEVDGLRGIDPQLGALEGRYRSLVLRFFELHQPERHSATGHHGEASGANQAFRVGAYSAVGGFHDLRTGEDRDIVRRLKQGGFAVCHAGDVHVRTSLRLKGRAPGGMSEALRARTSGDDYCIDECLPPADWLWRNRFELPAWPHDGSGYEAIHVRDLPRCIADLEALIATAVPGWSQIANSGAAPAVA